MSTPNQKNIGNGGSPFPSMIKHIMMLKSAASSGDYDSVNKLNSRGLLSAAASAGFPLASQKGVHGFVG